MYVQKHPLQDQGSQNIYTCTCIHVPCDIDDSSILHHVHVHVPVNRHAHIHVQYMCLYCNSFWTSNLKSTVSSILSHMYVDECSAVPAVSVG